MLYILFCSYKSDHKHGFNNYYLHVLLVVTENGVIDKFSQVD